MIHSAKPIVTPVGNIFCCCFVLLDLKSGDGRTDNMCENNDSYRPELWVGQVDQFSFSSNMSIKSKFLSRWTQFKIRLKTWKALQPALFYPIGRPIVTAGSDDNFYLSVHLLSQNLARQNKSSPDLNIFATESVRVDLSWLLPYLTPSLSTC